MATILAAEVERVWASRQMPPLNEALTLAYTKIFEKALSEGLGVNVDEIDYTTPVNLFIAALRNNCYQFSAAKNYTQLKHLTQALVGEDGRLRSWGEFKKVAFEINNQHVVQWLRTEYDTAVGAAQMASLWQGIVANKDTLPLLQFDAVIDQRTSDTCRPLEGVIKPWNDPFWDTYYPPNHFGCRSTVRQLASGTVTPDSAITPPEKLPAMFATNLAKSGMLFPPNHPYFIGKPEKLDSVYVAPPASDREAVTQAVFAMAQNNPEWFAHGFKQVAVTKKKSVNGFTDLYGNIYLTPERMKLCASGIAKLRYGNDASIEEEDALSTLWHEIWHNRYKGPPVRLTSTTRQYMELANEYVSRNSLPEFFRAIGGRLSNRSLMDHRASTGYNTMVKNFEALVQWCGADKTKVLAHISNHLVNERYDDQKRGLVEAIKLYSSFEVKSLQTMLALAASQSEQAFEAILAQKERPTR